MSGFEVVNLTVVAALGESPPNYDLDRWWFALRGWDDFGGVVSFVA